MHLRKLTLTVGLFGALFNTWAFGLGLGEITLRSTLNQPLDAEIKLLQVRNLNKEEILVELATTGDFERFGIERLFFLQNLKFDVQLDHPNGPMVRVRSDEPVREPYLVFLIQAQSPSSGRLLREYTLLMDLPVFADEAAAPVQAPARQPEPEAQPAIRPQPTTTSPAATGLVQREGEPPRAQPAPGRSPAPQSSVTSGTNVYGPVQANDTLWEIASRVRPSGVSIQQSMLALQKANPDAFINDNINLLKRGQVLRIPDSGEWQALDQQAAVREVALQNTEWNQGRIESGSGAELAASASRPARQRSTDAPRGQLTLSAPGSADRADEVSGAGSTGARGEALENELAIASEELDAARRENRELNSRIQEMEEQIATMERLLDVSSAELRALQLAAEQSLPTEAEVDVTEEIGAEEKPVAEPVEPAVENEAGAEEQTAAEIASPAPVAQPATTVAPKQPEPSLMDKIMAQIWYLLAAVAALVAGLAYFLHRRRQADEWESFEEDDIFGIEPGDDLASEEFLEEGEGLHAGLDAQAADDLADTDLEFDIDEPVQAETGDVVAEADIYIAYGKLEQAEEMLRRALADDPGNLDARLKLLEVYVENQDVNAFDGEYQTLLNSGDSRASSRAAELRVGIADAPPFAGNLSAGSFEQDIFEQDLDADNDQEPLLQLDDEHAQADSGFGELSLDLDDLGSEADTTAATDDGGINVESLDFSLDLSDEGETSTEAAAFDFELDSGAEAELSSNEESGNLLGDLELNLDGDLLELEVGSDSVIDTGSSEGGSLSDDFSFDLDLDYDGSPTAATNNDESDLDLSLALDGLEQGQDDAASEDGALNFDGLSLEPESATEGGDALFGNDEEQQDALTLTDNESGSIGDDGFDMELGDLDLEALDQEMDALVGAVDDEDVAMAEPLTLAEEDSVEDAIPSSATESEALNIDLKLDDLSAEQVAELAEDNPFGDDQDFDPDDLDDEFDFLAESDEVATKLDLARAYIDMGDKDGARDILDEVSSEGNDEQKREAQELLEKMV